MNAGTGPPHDGTTGRGRTGGRGARTAWVGLARPAERRWSSGRPRPCTLPALAGDRSNRRREWGGGGGSSSAQDTGPARNRAGGAAGLRPGQRRGLGGAASRPLATGVAWRPGREPPASSGSWAWEAIACGRGGPPPPEQRERVPGVEELREARGARGRRRDLELGVHSLCRPRPTAACRTLRVCAGSRLPLPRRRRRWSPINAGEGRGQRVLPPPMAVAPACCLRGCPSAHTGCALRPVVSAGVAPGRRTMTNVGSGPDRHSGERWWSQDGEPD